MNTYQEKKQSKIVKYKQLAEKKLSEADALRKRSENLSKAFEGGQPILVGHHSEKRSRITQLRMHRAMQKGIEKEEQAKRLLQKAEATKNNNAISSDDPEAEKKLNEKLKSIVNQIEIAKQNKEEDFVIRNLRANLSATKKRLEKLLATKKIESSTEVINGTTIEVDQESNRVLIYFAGTPPEATRSKLKGSGYLWTPSRQAWSRKLTKQAIEAGMAILKEIPIC